jgi:squalene-hopene/tetraprenyl-beta-curcumene cyclase
VTVQKGFIVLLIATALGSSLHAAAPQPSDLRAAVQNSIPFLQEKGAWWIEKKDCVSCHRVTNMVWTLSAAKDRGFKVSDELDEWISWSIESSLSKNDEDKIVGLSNKEGVAQLLIGVGDELDEDSYQRLAALLTKDQQEDGSWRAGGQLPAQKRPKPETNQTSTMWLSLAMQQKKPGDQEKPVLDKAGQFIETTAEGKSTEWFALRLLLASQLDDGKTRDEMVKRLVKQQQSDGGWGWMVDAESDALGTGMAIYALAQSNNPEAQAAIERGQVFLMETQRDDGSWPVKGTKEKRKDKVSETAVYWGTAWAALALIETLPETGPIQARQDNPVEQLDVAKAPTDQTP